MLNILNIIPNYVIIVIIIIERLIYMKKCTAKLLCVLFIMVISSMYLSCGNDTDLNPDSESKTSLQETEFDPSQARLAIPDDLPASDFEDYEYRILTYSPNTYYIEEETGDVVEDAIFRRNILVEDRFNVKISIITSPGISQLDATLKSSVMAGEDAFDLAIPHQITSGP